MRYYRVQVPQSSDTPANSTPLSWDITLAQQLGDVVIFVRDTIPPGQGTDGNAGAAAGNSAAGSGYFQDWYDDNSYLSTNPYVVIDNPGTTSLILPPVEPGKVYYLGVYARTDATFDISSAVGANKLAITGVIPFSNGTVTRTLAAGESLLYRIDTPADAVVWHHTAQHVAGVQLYLGQGTVPPKNSYAHWRSSSYANTILNQNMTAFPWQPANSYYLIVENTTGSAQTFSLTMDGRTSTVALSETIAGNGSGSINSSPAGYGCQTPSCSYNVMPYTQVTLSAPAATGSTFAGWSGACTGTGYYCTVPMTQAAAVTATFNLNSYSVSVYTGNHATVTSIPAGMTCSGSWCSGTYPYGTNVTLTVNPNSGYVFTGWSGGACTGTGNCAFTLGGGTSYTANLAAGQTLTVSTAGTGDGSVNSNPAGIACVTGSSANCSALFAGGTSVTLMPLPDSNSTFDGWSGACSNATGNCAVAMSGAITATATFTSVPLARLFETLAPFTLLQNAYNAALTGNSVQGRAVTFTENLIFNRPVNLFLKGGYDSSYGSAGGVTTIDGSLRIRSGTVRVNKVKIK